MKRPRNRRAGAQRLSYLHATLALAALISGCAHKKHARKIPPPPPPPAARHSTAPPAAPPTPGTTETGIASWYGHPYHGRRAADGEIYDMETLVAAHRTLPFNTWVRVYDLDNGKTVDVRIIDRGPFVDGRIIDLSHAAANSHRDDRTWYRQRTRRDPRRLLNRLQPGYLPFRSVLTSIAIMPSERAVKCSLTVNPASCWKRVSGAFWSAAKPLKMPPRPWRPKIRQNSPEKKSAFVVRIEGTT